MNLGAPEILIGLLVIALLFGSTKLPKLARSLGSAKGEFEKGIKDGEKLSVDAKMDEAKKDEATEEEAKKDVAPES